MSMTERIFALDANIINNEIFLTGINELLAKVTRCVGYWNCTYVVVFDDQKFASLLESFNGGSVSCDKIYKMNCNNKNLFEAMFNNQPLNVGGTLIQLNIVNGITKLVRFLKDNQHHREIFGYSTFFDKPINILAMMYSVGMKQVKKFRLYTLINHVCHIKGQDIFKVEPCDFFPFKDIPLVTLDLEVVAERLETFPLGLKPDEMITHVAIVVTYRTQKLVYAIVVQGADPIEAEMSPSRIIIPVQSEKDLLLQLFADFSTHKFLKVFGVSRNTAFLLTGYNIDNFDLPYIYARCIFHNLLDFANHMDIKSGISKRAFSFDLWHAEARIFANISNCSLKKVAAQFLKSDRKIELSVVGIRELYNGGHVYLDLAKNQGETYFTLKGDRTSVPTAKFFLQYNIQDCELIPKLYEAQAVLDLLHRMCVFCNLPFHRAIACGNSLRLENLMFLFAFNKETWLLPIPNLHIPAVDLTTDLYNQIFKADTTAQDLSQITKTCKDYAITFEDQEDELYFVSSTKGFAGGANDAIRFIGRNVFGLDAESFYPSIIKEYNLDLNNVIILDSKMVPRQYRKLLCSKHYVFRYSNLTGSVINTAEWSWPQLQEIQDETGLVLIIFKTRSMLKDLVQQLLNDRAECKNLLKIKYDSTVKAKELAYKVMSCCVFGVLGYKDFLYERIFVAAAITFLARNILKLCIQRLTPKNVSIVYVDTDGIMCFCPKINSQEMVNLLAVEISSELGFQCIRFKPENLYQIVNVLSCKKYLTFDYPKEGACELVCKGFEKNAIQPIKSLFQDWFRYYFTSLLKYNLDVYNVETDLRSLLLAAFTYLHNYQGNYTEYCVNKVVRSSTSSKELEGFYHKLIAAGTNPGDRVSIIPVLDEEDDEIFKLSEFYNGERINYKYLLRNYATYLQSFSSSITETVSNEIMNVVWRSFKGGETASFTDVEIKVRKG